MCNGTRCYIYNYMHDQHCFIFILSVKALRKNVTAKCVSGYEVDRILSER